VSAKSGVNVEDLFGKIVEDLLEPVMKKKDNVNQGVEE
jgi:translation elongation factor EF-4